MLERVQLVGPGAQEDGLAVVGGSEQQQDFFQRGEHRRLITGPPAITGKAALVLVAQGPARYPGE